MLKKFLCLFVFIACLACVFPAYLSAQYSAEDISVPPGYRVFKVAETNRVYDPYRLAFDSSGNLFVASYGFLVYKIDANGEAQVIGKTRKHDIAPTEIEIGPGGGFVIRSISLNTHAIYIFNPPDSYEKVIETTAISAIGYDRLGNFYASVLGPPIPGSNPVRYYFDIVRYDSDFNPVQIAYRSRMFISDFAFDAENNMYALLPGSNAINNGFIYKVLSGANGLPDMEDSGIIHAQYLFNAGSMAIDNGGNLYLDEFRRTETNGYSTYTVNGLTKVDSNGNVLRVPGLEFQNSQGLACRSDALYVSELSRGVISRVDLTSFAKSDFTEDRGIDSAGPIAWDANDNLFTSSFRQLRMLKLNPDGTFGQVGPGTGYMQSIAFDGSQFYIGSAPTNGQSMRILRIDPVTGSQATVADGVSGFRTVVFDSYGRLILNTVIDEPRNEFGANIIDTYTGASTPYLIGLHNKGRCIKFDGRQNIYFVHGNGDGIKKIALDLYYEPPRDLSTEPLFYDFVTPGYASPTIYFFAVNPLEEAFVPRMDSGDVLFCGPGGTVTPLAQGFNLPSHAAIDRFGALYISDNANGIFKIVHERWAVPAVIAIKDMMLDEIRGSAIAMGLKNSLMVKLENADKQLERGSLTITPAINMIRAFMNEVKAQCGKGIPEDQAARWIETAEKIINALREVV